MELIDGNGQFAFCCDVNPSSITQVANGWFYSGVPASLSTLGTVPGFSECEKSRDRWDVGRLTVPEGMDVT